MNIFSEDLPSKDKKQSFLPLCLIAISTPNSNCLNGFLIPRASLPVRVSIFFSKIWLPWGSTRQNPPFDFTALYK